MIGTEWYFNGCKLHNLFECICVVRDILFTFSSNLIWLFVYCDLYPQNQHSISFVVLVDFVSYICSNFKFYLFCKPDKFRPVFSDPLWKVFSYKNICSTKKFWFPEHSFFILVIHRVIVNKVIITMKTNFPVLIAVLNFCPQ